MVNLDELEDAHLAQETQSHMSIDSPQSSSHPHTASDTQPPARKSLSALAAAARKPSSAGSSKLASLGSTKSKTAGSLSERSSLSSLAAKSHGASLSVARRPLSSLASKATAASHDVDMSNTAQTSLSPSQPKLSKLQQRIQRGGVESRSVHGKTDHSSKEEEVAEADIWQLPSCPLFKLDTKIHLSPSPFAGVLAPSHACHHGPEPETVTTQAINAGLEKLHRPPPSQLSQRTASANNTGNVVTPLWK